MEHQLQKGMFTAPRPLEPTENELAITAGIELAKGNNREIDDDTARCIAGSLPARQDSAVNLFAMSGQIDESRLYDELAEAYEYQLDPQVREWIDRLACFCIAMAERHDP